MSGHIVLIGLSGSGKSTVAQLLAQALGRPVYDTDALLAARSGVLVPELLKAAPDRFRALEEEIVAAACAAPAGVIATGGGVVLSARNRAALRRGNRVVWLRAPVCVLAARLQTGEERPLLAGDPAARLDLLAAERAHLYAACAHDALDTDGLSPGEVAQRLLARVADWQASHAP
jgi:shikimate kinase